jgi:hypothetical protein
MPRLQPIGCGPIARRSVEIKVHALGGMLKHKASEEQHIVPPAMA